MQGSGADADVAREMHAATGVDGVAAAAAAAAAVPLAGIVLIFGCGVEFRSCAYACARLAVFPSSLLLLVLLFLLLMV